MSKPKHPRTLAETHAEALLRNVRVSPRKLNLVAGMIRNMPVSDALAMGRLIREKKFATEVEANRYCASSCPLMFVGGTERRAGEIGEVITGKKPGRTSEAEITLFDSTGVALQDSATVPLEYERAVAAGVGVEKKVIST